MSGTEPTPRYPTSRVALHWLTVVLVVTDAALGLWISDLGEDPLRLWGSRAHLLLGLLTGAVLLARLLFWARSKPVAPLPVGPGHQRFIRVVHVALYAAGLAMVGAGMATAFQSGWPTYLSGELATAPSFEGIEVREVHETLVFLFFGLVMVHVAGVLNHERLHGGALRRMLGGPASPG